MPDPTPEQLEYAGALLRRAESDLRALDALLAAARMEDDVIGFHAQQAVEKSVKVGLVVLGVAFPKTHDLDFMLARARDHSAELPHLLEQASWLTPWAAQLRYDEPPSRLNRSMAREVAHVAVSWARATVDRST